MLINQLFLCLAVKDGSFSSLRQQWADDEIYLPIYAVFFPHFYKKTWQGVLKFHADFNIAAESEVK